MKSAIQVAMEVAMQVAMEVAIEVAIGVAINAAMNVAMQEAHMTSPAICRYIRERPTYRIATKYAIKKKWVFQP